MSLRLQLLKLATKNEHKSVCSVQEGRKISQSVREVEYTTCYMCACRCGIKVHQDGKIPIEGNRNHPVNKGVLCAKGSAGIMQHYSPARLTKPLKQVENADPAI